MSVLTTANHWGSYRAMVENGRLMALDPLIADDDVSEMTGSIIDTLDAPSRVRTPSIRESWLDGGPGTAGDRRGADRFVAVSWDCALDLLAAELERVRATHGNEAIFAGSYGWASAGRFHHAQSQLHHFYTQFGGYVRSVNAYSFAAGEVILPHVIVDLRWTMTNVPTWHEISEHTDLIVAFGGLPLKTPKSTMAAWESTRLGDGSRGVPKRASER